MNGSSELQVLLSLLALFQSTLLLWAGLGGFRKGGMNRKKETTRTYFIVYGLGSGELVSRSIINGDIWSYYRLIGLWLYLLSPPDPPRQEAASSREAQKPTT